MESRETPSGEGKNQRDNTKVPQFVSELLVTSRSTIQDLLHKIIPKEALEAWKELDHVWEKLDGYDMHFFLPVHRIPNKDYLVSLDKDELIAEIMDSESAIIQSAKNTLNNIPKEDPLKGLYEEAISLFEEEKYLGGQALLANIFNLIRDCRFKKKPLTNRDRDKVLLSFEESSWDEINEYVTEISSIYEQDFLKLALMTGYVFSYTGLLPEGHDPKYSPSRNAMNHTSATYFSHFNALCFLLYVSEVFDLVHKLTVVEIPNPLIKLKWMWEIDQEWVKTRYVFGSYEAIWLALETGQCSLTKEGQMAGRLVVTATGEEWPLKATQVIP